MGKSGILLYSLVVAAVGVAGCGGASNSGSDPPNGGTAAGQAGVDAPKSLSEAVEKLVELRDAMAAGYEAGDASAVDSAWHKMAPIARKASELAGSSNLNRYDEADAEEAANNVVEILKSLHPPHGADAKVDPATYQAQEEELNGAIAKLEAIAAKTKGGAAAE